MAELPPVTIVPLGAAHLTLAAALHRESFADEPWDEKSIAEILAMPGALGWIALAGDSEPLGLMLALVVRPECELLSIAVRPAHRRAGVGRMLLDRFLRDARAAAANVAFLEVAADNKGAIALYESYEFLRIGERPDYYRRSGNRRVSALLLRRALG